MNSRWKKIIKLNNNDETPTEEGLQLLKGSKEKPDENQKCKVMQSEQ